MKKLNIRPDTGVYGTYKRISYQPWTALAEFVDNSTQSFYDHEDELFDTKYYKGLEVEIEYNENPAVGDEIIIRDNAYGMDYRDFQRAIILDKPPINTNGRNEFGMGLKAAACWFGNLWSVETTSLGSHFKYKATIDIDNLIKYKNEEIDVDDEKTNPNDHYTIITIRKLNQTIKGVRIERKIRELLASIYRADFRTGKIKIFFNGDQLEFEEVKPFIDQNNKEWKKNIEFMIPHKGENLIVKGFVAIRIPANIRNAGFTLMRRGRVIIGGPEKNYRPTEIFGPSNSYAYQRMYGELEMDNWPVTQAKDGFDWSYEDLENKFIDKLVELTSDYRNFADNLRTREKVDTTEISESLSKSLSKNKNFTDVNVTIGDINKTDEQINKKEEAIIEEDFDLLTAQEQETPGNGVEIIDNTPVNLSMDYKGNSYKFVFIFDDKNPKSGWLKLETIDKETNEYRLTLNVCNAFFAPFIQKKDFLIILAKFACALAIAEISSYSLSSDGKVSPSFIRTTMSTILGDFINE